MESIVEIESSYQSQSDPGLCQVHQDAVLGPTSCGSNLLQRQVVAILLQVDLYDQGNCIDCGYTNVSFVVTATNYYWQENSRFP